MDLILLPLPTPSPRMLIDIMIFHLNLTQTILEPYSNTAEVFPFQTKRKKKSLACFTISTSPSPTSHSLCFWLHFLLLSVYIVPLLQSHFFWKSKMSLSRHPCASCSLPRNALPLSNMLSSSVPSVSIIPHIASSLKSSVSLLCMYIHHVYHTS